MNPGVQRSIGVCIHTGRDVPKNATYSEISMVSIKPIIASIATTSITMQCLYCNLIGWSRATELIVVRWAAWPRSYGQLWGRQYFVRELALTCTRQARQNKAK